jgi:tRNA threonylcarbamoyladenosine biosynthesis protein TsaE
MSGSFEVKSAEAMRVLGAEFAQRIRSGVVALSGELGAGKTTFVQGILAGLGAEGHFTSPTFVLMKQYDLSVPMRGVERVYHVDAYRVGEEDLCAQGFTEWANDPAGVVLLEWPERVSGLVPEKAIRISITVEKEGRRIAWQKSDEEKLFVK